MIPLFLDPAQGRAAVVGRGLLALRRLIWLREAGADPDVFSDEPEPELAAAAGARLVERLPSTKDLASFKAVWISDLPHNLAKPIALVARAVRVLVNVEDMPALCDFHTPAVLRRGKLTLAAGTGGASPAVARAARERLEEVFPETWADALDDIAQSRAALRENGAGFDDLVADARKRLAAHGLS